MATRLRSRARTDRVLKVGAEFPMSRLARRALMLFAAYATVLAAVVVAGFLGQAIGIWASVLWGAGILAGLGIYARRRHRATQTPEPD